MPRDFKHDANQLVISHLLNLVLREKSIPGTLVNFRCNQAAGNAEKIVI